MLQVMGTLNIFYASVLEFTELELWDYNFFKGFPES
tara:strand:- start:301 stop:408 length:108 start_codon:yes stop_codon:yes gene_type:complete